ncbi:BRO1 domain-containing protein [Artemisia annua]|uniref:BRO1 domain-containing protein n=1 Tax=Artemisia annua TaxID=35608 RepID=A0A2U1N079_ARTAN|nr:BRO1 domain-containing protein [Artemisia annua]
MLNFIDLLNLRTKMIVFEDVYPAQDSFQTDNLHFELGIVLFFYGAVLREWGSQVLSTDLLQSATLLRRAAGVYRYLAYEFLPLFKDAQSSECLPEATIPVSYEPHLLG